MVTFPLPVAILHDLFSAPCALSKLLRLGSGNEVIQDGDRKRRAVLPWGVYHYTWWAAQMFSSWSSIVSQICVRKLQRDPAPPSHLGVNITPARLVGQWNVIFCHVNRYHIHVILSFSYTSISCHQSYSLSINSKDFSQNKIKIILCCMWHSQNRNFLLERDTCYLGSSQLSDAFAWWRHQMKKKSALLALTEASGAELWFFILAWTNGWVNNRNTSDLRRHRAHYDVTVNGDMIRYLCSNTVAWSIGTKTKYAW